MKSLSYAQPTEGPEVFLQEAASRLSRWAEEVDVLSARTESLSGDEKVIALTHEAQLKAKLVIARHRLVALKASSHEKWLETKHGVDALWSELEGGFARGRK